MGVYKFEKNDNIILFSTCT